MLIDSTPASAPAAVLQSDLLAQVPGIVHGITSRVAGMGHADGNVAYSPPRDQDDAWVMRTAWCASLDIDPESIVTAGQVHGSTTHVVTTDHIGTGARPGSGRVALCDALVTSSAGLVLLTLHADCLPLILVDPDGPAVATVHAGWRGTVAGVTTAAVHAMATELGSDPNRMLAFLGPSICQRCYEVGDEVVAAWRSLAGNDAEFALTDASPRFHFDLREANRFLLLRAGLDETHIDMSHICTKCQSDEWFSHRGQGPNTGRFGAFVVITGA